MNIQQAKEIVERFNQGKVTAEEKSRLNNWYARESLKQMQNPEFEDYHRIKAELFTFLRQYPEQHEQVIHETPLQLSIRLRIFKKSYKYVAAAIAFIVFGLWFYYASYKPNVNRNSQIVNQNDIAPGKNTATITLANGKTIILSDAKTGVIIGNDLTYNDGSAVANLSPSGRDGVAREGSNNNNPLSPQGGSLPEGERSMMLTASTPRGGTYQITLSDGTKVWLNADSKISFPSQFSGKERRILLSGEAYFEIAKDKAHPFVVKSRGQEVEVLGTHFNINSYDDEPVVKTTLLEGSVKVIKSGTAKLKLLKPGQMSIVNDEIFVSQANVNQAIAWKNGDFMFRNESLESIMRQLARWYNVEVVYKDNIKDKTFWGTINRFSNISEVLEILELTGKVHFKIEGRRITIMK